MFIAKIFICAGKLVLQLRSNVLFARFRNRVWVATLIALDVDIDVSRSNFPLIATNNFFFPCCSNCRFILSPMEFMRNSINNIILGDVI